MTKMTVQQKAQAWDVMESMANKKPANKTEEAIKQVLRLTMEASEKLVRAELADMMIQGGR